MDHLYSNMYTNQGHHSLKVEISTQAELQICKVEVFMIHRFFCKCKPSDMYKEYTQFEGTAASRPRSQHMQNCAYAKWRYLWITVFFASPSQVPIGALLRQKISQSSLHCLLLSSAIQHPKVQQTCAWVWVQAGTNPTSFLYTHV